MTAILCAILASLSIWDYPARAARHDILRRQFLGALRTGDVAAMVSASTSGVELLPDDPTWRYNLACSLAYFPSRSAEALDTLEKAIDLGFRDADAIAADGDLKKLSGERRYLELIEYAKEMKSRPLMFGPMATVDATGVFGSSLSLGEQNMGWDFDARCFVAHVKLATASADPWTGDIYMNRDRAHSMLKISDFPGITEVGLDREGRERGIDVNLPNILFPYPVFGNCSRAFVGSPLWRSLPRALTTTMSSQLPAMERAYLSNQIWVFPSNADTPPVGTNGDVFASITPYCMTTAGRSFSDLPYLRAALYASAAFHRDTKAEIVRKGLLAPTIMTLIRKSLGVVSSEDDYTSARAHPTALPQNGVNTNRLIAAAAAMTSAEVPPVVRIAVRTPPLANPPKWPELTYASRCAWAFVLRSDEISRVFFIAAEGAKEYRFVQTHGTGVKVEIDKVAPNAAKVTIDRRGMHPVNRVDIAVFGRNPGTGWGAPSYVCFARMDPTAPYSDPVLMPQEAPPEKGTSPTKETPSAKDTPPAKKPPSK